MCELVRRCAYQARGPRDPVVKDIDARQGAQIEVREIDLLAANKDITSFHLNIGLCLQGGGDPIAFIQQCPGRIQSLLVQDYKGQARWKEIFSAAEKTGRLQFYLLQRTDGLFLVQREGDDLLDFAAKDLQYFRQLHG